MNNSFKLIIAEKPSVARDIAAIVGARNKADGYLHGNGYAVTWAFGHLVQLAMPEEYGVIGFNRENLPIIPDKFKLIIRQVRDGKTYKSDSGAKKQLHIIEKLFKECESIIVATDAGREGELIFRYIYEYLNCTKPFERLWISSLTDSAIKEGFDNLKDGADYDNLFDAARSRSEADWLVGINATQALTISAGGGLLSLGRVQTPTLAMICERYKANKEFLSESYFKVNIDVVGHSATAQRHYDTPNAAETKCQELQNAGTLRVESIESREHKENAPLLYDLTTLQKDANKRYGYTAQETLSTAQELYEKKYISYPRTGSRYISQDVFEKMNDIVSSLSRSDKWAALTESLNENPFNAVSVDDTKVTDHHALLPTEVQPKELSAKGQNIYEMIVCRTIESLMQPCRKLTTTVILDDGFSVKSTQVIELGWREVRMEMPEESIDIASIFTEGESYAIDAVEAVQCHTKPKPIHTESSLLSAMETAGKDMGAIEGLADLGLGTPATRAATIETLIARGYIVRDGKSLIPTPKGMDVYNIVKDMRISNVILTGEWENGLLSIEKGELDSETFDNISREYTRRITSELLSKSVSVGSSNDFACPKCGAKSIHIYDKVAKCKSEGCDFVIFRTLAGKHLTDKHIADLLTKGKTATIKGLTSKAGKSFDAAVILDAEHKTALQFNTDKKTSKK